MAVEFLSIREFKGKEGIDSMKVLRNPKTGKLFLAGDNGKNYKVQGSINSSEDMSILVEDGKIEDACLINTSGGAEEIFAL